MDNCFPKYYDSLGTHNYAVRRLPEFKNIEKLVRQKTSSLINQHDKNKFREGCRDLADYLINNNNPPKYYEHYKVTWKGTLNYWLKGYYKNLIKFGGCPLILEEKDKQILELKYEEIDFCDKKKRDLDEIKELSTDPKNYNTYISRCNAYNEWIEQKKKHFEENKNLLRTCYQAKQRKKQKGGKMQKESSELICDLLNPETFREIPECPSLDKLSPPKTVPTSEEIGKQSQDQGTRKNSVKIQVQPDQDLPSQSTEEAKDIEMSKDIYETQLELRSIPLKEHISKVQKSSSEPSAMESEAISTHDIHVKPSQYVTDSQVPPSEEATLYKPPYPVPQSPGIPIVPEFSRLPGYALIGRFKKNKNIKRRQVEFLRIRIPPHSDEKGELLVQENLENQIYDDEQIIKKLKIHEHDIIKNANVSKHKKDRFKTIIEVHMQVLEKFRNEECEYKKGEFLELCLELFAEEQCITFPNITNEELIKKDIKGINNIEKQKIVWNKWRNEHRNISKELKKTEWFNYLINEWKKEKSSIKISEELKMNYSNEIQKRSFSKKEKDLWREWISKKRMIIEQYLEQEWYKEMTQEFLNMLDEYVNEETKNNISLLNIEELQQKESYEELYNYIKKKLLEKMCILVFMMILEDCIKQDFIENEESHLDSAINDWKTEVNLDRKTDVTKDIIEVNENVLENGENRKTYAYIGQ
ncbi:STP1 protein [Plasmodium malariae]|uniref:STP1 protein n=1 Tax=Plasmodium malariae TaxID=5858 RepID=A0A1A8WTS8_PLAMA|nr:STP1 protein [Plasmodium malariae]